ncbi:MAG: ribose-5-phosphate isomerase RpiA [Anaerolineales bacterium]|nr:ribose-5-phosphate isomerase RpiA [Anaerolineales bacterium]
MANDRDELKKMAGEKAVEYIESGMVVGLGYGSTAIHALRLIGELIRRGELEGIQAIPTASLIAEEARRAEIPLTSLEEHPRIDVTIDGADEVDPELNLIKGGGGALLREKIVAQATLLNIIVVDEQKLSPVLGTNFDLPVEIISFGWRPLEEYLRSLGAEPQLRTKTDGAAFVTDSGNYILDCHFGPIDDPYALSAELKSRAGIVEHGLFLDLASEVIIAAGDGIRSLKRD